MFNRIVGRVLIAGAASTLCLGSSLGAQTCTGAASYKVGPMRAGAGLEVGDHATTYGAAFGLGALIGPFGSVSLSRTEYDNVDGGGTTVGLNAGYAIDVNLTKTMQFCPIGGFRYQSGPNIQSAFGNVDVTAHAVEFGGSFGGVATSTPTFVFVPFGAASYVASRASASLAGFNTSDSQDYTLLTLGAGFIVNHTLTIRPSVVIPVGLDGATSSFAIDFGFSFGETGPRR